MKKLLEREEIKLAFEGKSCIGIDVKCFDLEDDFSLDGFDVCVVNVKWPDCRVRVSVGNGNVVNIVGFPKWVGQSLWIASLGGMEESIETLRNLIRGNIEQVSNESVYTGAKQ